MMELYRNIKNLRNARAMTQGELALKVGYADKGMISRVESGTVDLPLSKVESFAAALKVTAPQLMGWDELPELEDPLISKLNRLNEVGRAYIDTQIDYALTRPDFVSKKNNTDHEEGVREEGAVG